LPGRKEKLRLKNEYFRLAISNYILGNYYSSYYILFQQGLAQEELI